jgi:hypothetical protein
MDKRLDGESYEDYKKRLKEQALYLKHRLKGVVFWQSRELKLENIPNEFNEDGSPKQKIAVYGRTYRKKDHEAG